MSEWKETRFGDFVVFNPRVKLTKGKEYPFILMEEIEPKVKFINSSSTKVYDGSGAKFENGDTLFARITPSLENGKIAQVSKIKRAGFGSTELYVFREKPNVSDKDFIYYMVRADFFIQNAVNSYVGASGRQRADAGFIANTILKLPELPIQHRIASILSAYDDMIENNNRRIALLEQMAEQIYKEWFVRMRFPGYENTEFEKGVPKGWEVNPILTLCSKITDGTHDTPKPVDEGGVPLITGTHIVDGRIDFDSAYKISIDDHTKIKQRSYLDKGDIIFSNIGTIGSIAIVNEDFEYSVKNVIIFKPLSIEYSLFLYYMIKSPSVKEQLMLDSSGTSQKFITLGYIRKVKTVIPETELIKKFSQLVRPMFLEKSNLQLQTQTLKQIRDLLLPRLISGKLKVNELREFELV